MSGTFHSPEPCIQLHRLPSTEIDVEHRHDFGALDADVVALFDTAERQDFQAGLDWLRLLGDTTCGAGDEVSLLLLRQCGRATAALPLITRVRGGRAEVSALSNFYTSRLVPPIAAGVGVSALAQLFTALRKQSPRPAVVNLAPFERQSSEYTALRDALRQAGLHAYEYFCFGNWFLPAEDHAGRADSYIASRPGEVRSTLRRMSRRFESAGGTIEVVSSPEDAERAIAAYLAVYAASWKQPEPHPEFIPGLIRLCARRGWLRMGVAWIGGRPVGAQLWIVAGGRAAIFKLAYDAEYARFSPGTLLTAALMRQALDVDRVAQVDYLTGDDAYKSAWMTHRRERWGLVAYEPRSPYGAWMLAREALARAAKHALARVRARPTDHTTKTTLTGTAGTTSAQRP
ncbi:MAG: GNAT family N-acetyltransferase [Rubrivivax sp.]|nr:GNAT family N-acetyltransferase [Rubrivivax sp.]